MGHLGAVVVAEGRVAVSLLASPAELAARRDVAARGGELAALASSLARDLQPLQGWDPFIPPEKALLSREGGRCPVDGSLLGFDPFSPHEHRCPACGRTFTGELHYRFWIYWYQLWLAERAVHGALLGALGFGDRYAAMARTILEAYASRYVSYPNRDNVLGPSRLFFSTYLESIWLLQICVAADLLRSGAPGAASYDATVQSVCDRIAVPSRALVTSYDEGASNRQVWNNAAVMAASMLLGDRPAAEARVFGDSGLAHHLAEGLLDDGTWFEGENYHLFAHRGLWYGVALAERAGLELDLFLRRRFQEAFATPFVTALPDYTLPSRRDSQYAISLRQWRFAESAELGLARGDDPRLIGALYHLYEDDVPHADTGRSISSAEVERNGPPSRLTRADLGWRSLLFAKPRLPILLPVPPASALLAGQGLAILRRDGSGAERGGSEARERQASVYVALDYGHPGGGHGHPDRLNLLLSDGATRWLDDMGTGSYVDPTLHWYRSTLAHNAPLADGKSQQRVHGNLIAYDDASDIGWAWAEAIDIAPGVSASRTVVVMAGYLVDEVRWHAEDDIMFDVPMHLDGTSLMLDDAMQPDTLPGGKALEDGFRFVHDTKAVDVPGGSVVRLDARSATTDSRLRVWCVAQHDSRWWRGLAPGPRQLDARVVERPFWLIRSEAAEGAVWSVFAWSPHVMDVSFAGAVAGRHAGPQHEGIVVKMSDVVRHMHTRAGAAGAGEDAWQVRITKGKDERIVRLGGFGAGASGHAARARVTPPFALPLRRELIRGIPLVLELGERHYRRSEESWIEAGRPRATVSIAWEANRGSQPMSDHGSSDAVLEVGISVHVGSRPLTFARADEVNPYDNESADINGDGIQVYLSTAVGDSAWMLVPEEAGRVRVRAIDAWPVERRVTALWSDTPDGYQVMLVIPLNDVPFPDAVVALDAIVNEKPPARLRRRGQLVMSGAHGEYVYLRGDRQEAHRLLSFRLRRA